MWHRTGTITVTKGSKTVTGAGGTAWVQNIRVGDALQGPDGRYYEVTNVASDTALSIEPAYMGNTASGQWYQILPILGQQKRLADRAAELVGAVGLLPGQVASNENRIANAEQVLGGLGTASKLTSATGIIDRTAGRALRIGDHGFAQMPAGMGYQDPLTFRGLGCYPTSPDTPNMLLPVAWDGGSKWGIILNVGDILGGHAFQLLKANSGDMYFAGKGSGTPSSPLEWHAFLTTKNCVIMENSNGFTLRHPNGWQFCWSVKQVALPTTSGQRVIQSFNVPSPFTPTNPVAKTFGVSIGHASPYSAYDYGFDGGASSPNVAFVSTIRGASEAARTATVTAQWTGKWS